jgi:hypothetical protein
MRQTNTVATINKLFVMAINPVREELIGGTLPDWRRPEQRGAPFWTGGDHRLAPVEELRTSQGKYKSPPPDSGFHYRLQPGKHASKNSGGTGLVPSWRTSNEAAAELRDTRFPPA